MYTISVVCFIIDVYGGRRAVVGGWQCEQQRCLSAGEWVRAARCSHAPCFLLAVADAAAADAVGGR